MDAVAYYRGVVTNQGYGADVVRSSGTSSYEDDAKTTVGTVTVAIADAASTSQMVTEGMDDDASFRGLVVPETDANGTLVETIAVGDELDLTAAPRRYIVRTKHGVPNDVDPEIWELGLDRANAE